MSQQGSAPRDGGSVGVRLTKWSAGVPSAESDDLAVEEPLEIRIGDQTATTTMRTPGHDRELALGFLLTDGWIRSLADVSSVAVCSADAEHSFGNTVVATPSAGHTLQTDPVERGLRRRTTSSACGVCGRARIEELLTLCSPVERELRLTPGALLALIGALPKQQPNFMRTGGVHGAAIAPAHGPLHRVFEDVGRHNAVDKAIGASLLGGLQADILLVSSRAGFEIVQKACVAQIPVVVTISAPTSLAVETARRFGLTLIGFARDSSLNVYADSGRLSGGGVGPLAR